MKKLVFIVMVFALLSSCKKDNKGKDNIFTDPRDGQNYTFKKIGTQVWMTQNLNYTTPDGSWCYDDRPGYCTTYGRLYDWNTALIAVPPGWHLPTVEEWVELIDFLGGRDVAGSAMQATSNWLTPNGATNSSGFAALPGGFKNPDGFRDIETHGFWWCSTNQGYTWTNSIWLQYFDSHVIITTIDNKDGLSVRCIRD